MLYLKPKLEILTFGINDIICQSPGQVEDQGNQDPGNPKDNNDLDGWV